MRLMRRREVGRAKGYKFLVEYSQTCAQIQNNQLSPQGNRIKLRQNQPHDWHPSPKLPADQPHPRPLPEAAGRPTPPPAPPQSCRQANPTPGPSPKLPAGQPHPRPLPEAAGRPTPPPAPPQSCWQANPTPGPSPKLWGGEKNPEIMGSLRESPSRRAAFMRPAASV